MNVDARPLIFEIAGSARRFGHFEFPSSVEMDRGAAEMDREQRKYFREQRKCV